MYRDVLTKNSIVFLQMSLILIRKVFPKNTSDDIISDFFFVYSGFNTVITFQNPEKA